MGEKRIGGEDWKAKEVRFNSQSFQRGLNIRKLEEDGFVRNILVIQHKADAPDNGREADVLCAG